MCGLPKDSFYVLDYNGVMLAAVNILGKDATYEYFHELPGATKCRGRAIFRREGEKGK